MLADVAIVVQLPHHVWLFTTPWTAAGQASDAIAQNWPPGVNWTVIFQNSRGIWDHLIAKNKVDVTGKMSSKSGNLGRVLRPRGICWDGGDTKKEMDRPQKRVLIDLFNQKTSVAYEQEADSSIEDNDSLSLRF